MEPPGTARRVSASGRTSVIDSLRGFTLSGVRIDKEDLRKKITFPEYLRRAMTEAIRAKDAEAAAVVQLYEAAHAGGGADPTEWPIVVFINSKSGGRHGPKLKARLQELMGEEQVNFDGSLLRARARADTCTIISGVDTLNLMRQSSLHLRLMQHGGTVYYNNRSVFFFSFPQFCD